MIDDDLWHSIRVLYFRKGKSKSWIAKELGLSRNTVKKYIASDDPPAYRLCKPRGRPVSNEWEEHVRSMLEQDQDAPRKQHHTAQRVFDRLVHEHGYDGGLRTVQYMVANIRQKHRDTFVPLQFEPGKDAQVDYGEAYAVIDGQRTKLHGFEMRLNYSRHKFQMYFPSPNMESFMEGQVRAFEFFGCVPERISYDNLTLAVVSVGKGKERKLTKSFKQLMGHYAFQANFCTPGESGAHEKGGVENGIGYSRRNWMVPMPKVSTIGELNSYLLQKCLDDMGRTVHGQKQSIAIAFELERSKLMPLPAGSFDPGVRKSGSIVDGYQTITFDNNRYSVPLEYVGKPLWFRAYWNRILIGCKSEVIAEHARDHGEDQYVLKPEHYFDLLERRPQAVQFARPLLQVEWPKEYWRFFETIKSAHGASDAGRQFVRLLRLHSQHGEQVTTRALQEAATAGACNVEVVMQIIDREKYERRVSDPIDVSDRPELNVTVVLAETAQYQQLIQGGGNEHCAA
jgi:transposase